ncbi:MAG: Gfo/Idh/MocA family protein [Planctomycetaceae bacterium]
MTDHAGATPSTTRRDFLKTSAAAVVGSGLLAQTDILRAAYVSGSETLRLGLVGCGGRGTGAAEQALNADPHTQLVALGDAFDDQLQSSLDRLKKSKAGERVAVDPDHQFVGFDAYQKVIDSDVDVVLLATPPHFRPIHLQAAIEAGKHVFAEKPVAVDAPGIRSVLAACEEAKNKNLSVVSGLCWRYETGMQTLIDRIHNGALGEIVALHSTRYNQGVSKGEPRTPEMSDMEYQLRNWYYYTWLSGDFNVEQFVHEMDKMAWIMQDQYPVECSSTGGRQTRTDDRYGNIFDHISTVFEYENGVKYFAATRQQEGCDSRFFDHVHGTAGMADLMKFTITGAQPWRWGRRKTVMHQLEHDAMYAALRNGETINNGDYMARSTMMGIMARMSAYTGKTITWKEAMESQELLAPAEYAFDAAPPKSPIAMPGLTPFV